VILVGVVQFIEQRLAGFVLGHPFPSELAAGDFIQNLLHFLFGVFGDHARAARQIAVFGGVGD